MIIITLHNNQKICKLEEMMVQGMDYITFRSPNASMHYGIWFLP